VSGVLFFAKEKLSSLENASLESEILLADILKVDRSYLRTHQEESVSLFHRLKFHYYLHLRSQHVPLSYIRGWKEWCGLRITVTSSVLIPRDETEVLFQKIIQSEKTPQKILDLGTGSGCLALALAKNYQQAEVTAIDFSRAALSVAQKNFRAHNVAVETEYSDLLSAISAKTKFDIIVANLPYVPTTLPIAPEVQKEPEEAIFSGKDGLELLARFARELEQKEIEFKSLWIEFLPEQWERIQQIFKKWDVKSHQDVGGDIYFARITSR